MPNGTDRKANMTEKSLTAKPTVLVVEDEMMLRLRAVDIVEDAGFSPLQAVNADEALALLESHADIKLLFTDIQMPGSMDGLKLAHAVHERWPAIKIILVSGQVTLDEGERPADSRFFGKPMKAKHMIAELQEMIGQGALTIFAAAKNGLAVNGARAEPRAINAIAVAANSQQSLTAENDSLRLLLQQANINAKVLLAQAGIDAKEREAADKLQKLILEELHHRIQNTLATVSAITSQACGRRSVSSTASKRSKAGWSRSDRRTICCCRRDGRAPAWCKSSAALSKPSTARGPANF